MYLRLDGEERPDWMCRGQLTPVGHTWVVHLYFTLYISDSLSLFFLPQVGKQIRRCEGPQE